MRATLVLLAFLLFTIHCGQTQADKMRRSVSIKSSLSNCRPDQFPLAGGWLGGDVAYSIPLSNKSTLWLFGDTFIGQEGASSRAGATMIGNSVAVSTCDEGGNTKLLYDWRREGDMARAVFEPKEAEHRFWPQDGFEHDGVLYVTLVQIRPTPEGGALGFEAVRSVLARVHNYTEPVAQWRINLTTLVEGKVLMGVSAIKEADHALLLTWVDSQNYFVSSPAVLARVPLNATHAPEHLSSDNVWRPGFEAKDAHVVFERGMTEMSVRYHESHRLWLAVTHETKFPSRHIVAQTASSLTGPWSHPRVIYSIPEMSPDSPLYDADTFCYASKEHVQFENNDSITVTYACNSFKSHKQLENLNIYVPKVVTIPWSVILKQRDKL